MGESGHSRTSGGTDAPRRRRIGPGDRVAEANRGADRPPRICRCSIRNRTCPPETPTWDRPPNRRGHLTLRQSEHRLQTRVMAAMPVTFTGLAPAAHSGVAEREELTETGRRSTARCCGRRGHRQADSMRVCSPVSRRVASLRSGSAGLGGLVADSAQVRPGRGLTTMPTHTPYMLWSPFCRE